MADYWNHNTAYHAELLDSVRHQARMCGWPSVHRRLVGKQDGLGLDRVRGAGAPHPTSIHPFRDVNTRSQHIMFNQLPRDAGWVIDWSQIPGDVFAHARTLAIVEDHSGIDALIRPNLYRLDGSMRPGEALTVEQVRSFQARGVSRTPDVRGKEEWGRASA